MLFGIGMFVIGDRHQAFARHAEYYCEFVNLAGLTKGAKVRVSGMDAGQGARDIRTRFSASRFRVKWRIDAKLSGLVRARFGRNDWHGRSGRRNIPVGSSRGALRRLRRHD